ncbi:MAG: chloride channel protein [Thermoplasmatota archaeon]
MSASRRFTALNGTAVLIGILAGLAAVLFRGLINFIETLAFRGEVDAGAIYHEEAYITTIWGVAVFMVPAVGGLVVGLVRQAFPEARRQGIAEVMAAVQARGGIIKGRTAWGHALLSAITVGTGGSSGREGPIGYIGAALGSSFGRRLGFKARDIKVLLGCGTAAGIAATFNAPLGGVLFAMELILPEFSTHAFIPVVIATVLGLTVANLILGDEPAFLLPESFVLQSPWELGIYLALGLACGVGGVGFIKTMGWANDLGDRIRMPIWIKPAIGGLLVGLLGLFIFQATGASAALGGNPQFHVFGTGYGTVNALLSGDPTALVIPLLLLLILAKPLASSITLGSGGGGGVFSASLMQGALYGGVFGIVANHFWPGDVAPASAYALVGMGAFYAASGRATLTTIVLLTELTDGYEIVMPIMFAAVTADAVSVALSKDSIYSIRLTKRGILFDHDRVQSALDLGSVDEVMTPDVDVLRDSLTVGAAFNQMLDQGHNGYPVIDEHERVVGVVTRSDLAKALHNGKGDAPLTAVVTGQLFTCCPDDRLHQVRDRMFQQDIGRLLVVDPRDKRRLLGIITRSDLLRGEAVHDIDHDAR